MYELLGAKRWYPPSMAERELEIEANMLRDQGRRLHNEAMLAEEVIDERLKFEQARAEVDIVRSESQLIDIAMEPRIRPGLPPMMGRGHRHHHHHHNSHGYHGIEYGMGSHNRSWELSDIVLDPSFNIPITHSRHIPGYRTSSVQGEISVAVFDGYQGGFGRSSASEFREATHRLIHLARRQGANGIIEFRHHVLPEGEFVKGVAVVVFPDFGGAGYPGMGSPRRLALEYGNGYGGGYGGGYGAGMGNGYGSGFGHGGRHRGGWSGRNRMITMSPYI